jgi:hypothetical protein
MASPSPMIRAVLLGAILLASPLAAAAQDQGAGRTEEGQGSAGGEAEGAAKRFNCQDGGALLARFATERGRLVAIVDAFDGDGPHTLISRPYNGPPVQLAWSDGRRTMTWSPGVQIMWMDASVHRMCGGGMMHHH